MVAWVGCAECHTASKPFARTARGRDDDRLQRAPARLIARRESRCAASFVVPSSLFERLCAAEAPTRPRLADQCSAAPDESGHNPMGFRGSGWTETGAAGQEALA